MDYVDNFRQRIRNQAFVLHWGKKTDFQSVQKSRKGRIAMVQKACKSIIALAFLVSVSATAQAPGAPASTPLTIKPDAPDRYVIVPGDTLWGISERYTDSPWRWPELWNMNREQIRNPHLIYPGYVILLDRDRARLTIAPPATEAKPEAAGEPGAPGVPPGAPTTAPGTLKLTPRLRAESLAKQEIPSIPPSAIEPFLSRPLVIEPDGLEKAPTIIATQQDRVVLAAGNSAYVRGIGASKDETWYVYRKGTALVDPDTNKTLGYEAIYLGTAQLTRPGEPATVVLTSAVQEVGAGDKLVAAGRPQPVNYAPHAPATQIKGRVIGIYGGVAHVGEAGPQSIISINRGKADGVEVGHVLALYNRGGTVRDRSKARSAPDARIQLPDERAGLAFVFRVFDRISYALIMQVTRPVSPLDVVQTP
ncbi:MAG TPA: LysM domain-containing protein [Burkholderiales bacterium]|nr:LysM domain-containing protein [Burkholderiales bacterium]